MRVVFLDMDGVLNSSDFFATGPKPQKGITRGSDDWWTCMVDPEAVTRLNAIVEATGAKIVVSSSWRYEVPPERMQRVLDARGFRGEVIGRTPLLHEVPAGIMNRGLRGTEIETWLANNKELGIESFVILDDMGRSAFGPFGLRLVWTSWGRGLLDVHVQQAIAMLKGEAVDRGRYQD